MCSLCLKRREKAPGLRRIVTGALERCHDVALPRDMRTGAGHGFFCGG
jgi:hypothetical protein